MCYSAAISGAIQCMVETMRELAPICPLLLSPHELLIMCKHLTYHHIITKLSHDIVIPKTFVLYVKT